MEKRYRALRTISVLYKILAVIMAVVTVVAAIAVCAISLIGGAAMQSTVKDASLPGVPLALAGVFYAVVFVIYGGLFSLTFYALGEGIDVLVSIESNTRATAEAVQRWGAQS